MTNLKPTSFEDFLFALRRSDLKLDFDTWLHIVIVYGELEKARSKCAKSDANKKT